MSIKKLLKIPLTPVESSAVAAHGYDPESKTMAIQFKDSEGRAGKVFHYSGVEPADYRQLAEAPSVGRHMNVVRKLFTAQHQPHYDIVSSDSEGGSAD